jgi:hypothetical protein
LGVTPYFGYVWLGEDYDFTGQQGLETKLDLSLADDDITVWFRVSTPGSPRSTRSFWRPT